jgi:hypothetical protein
MDRRAEQSLTRAIAHEHRHVRRNALTTGKAQVKNVFIGGDRGPLRRLAGPPRVGKS